MPAPLSVNGRLYHQGFNRIIAMDSYNGAILWSLEVPDLLRVNTPRDSGPWCADEDDVYVAVADACWRLDGYTGRRTATYRLPQQDTDIGHDWGYIARHRGVLYGSGVKEGSRYVNIWGGGGEGWYDGRDGPTAEKVCSDYLFAQSVADPKQRWTYANGAIINSTITIGGDRIYFVESRNPKVVGHSTGRIGLDELWSDQFLVALNAQTGKTLWEKSLDVPKGIVVFYMSYGSEKLFITSSASNKYNICAFDARNGNALWEASHNWPSNNHGGHMQHPVVVGNSIYLEPCGYDIADGRRITDKMGRHEGCATYMATSGALIYRGKGRQIAMWDMNTNKVTTWRSLRPSCWLSTIAADGMLLFPEGGGGCSCANWLQTSLGFVAVDK
jgi:outer membrane protein assembly factor BamB